MSGRARVRAAAAEWQVPDPRPSVEGLDPRLLAVLGRTGLLQVVIDHDSPAAGRCPGCGWVPTDRRRDCPSRVIALAVLERKALPAWLAHLAEQVPGARVKRAAVSEAERRAAEDELPGLFEAPARTTPRGQQVSDQGGR